MGVADRDRGASDSSLPGGIELPPVAPMLMESLRAVGYSAPAALADLVDNSIAAESHNISITYSLAPTPFLAIIDDGDGLDQAQLIAAMRYGSRDPREKRAATDLGRFGLGLKTASLSQCRKMTVVSMFEGQVSVAVWDLDECDRRGCWWLSTPDTSAVPAEVIDTLRKRQRGTAVVWEHLDRLLEGSHDAARTLDRIMDQAADHLAMVFHRFLDGQLVGPFEITVNGRPLPRLDPFLEGHLKGQALRPESFQVEGHEVTVSPFVLPFPSRLGPKELERAGGRESLKTGHGFYIYRGGRLVVPGGWFRIVPSDDLMRLARVRVDVPSELDHIWKVDIRKTVAEPPSALRPELRRIVGQATTRSRRVYSHRGTTHLDRDRVPLWARQDLRDGAATWKVNAEHPVVKAALAASEDPRHLKSLLGLMEEQLPLHDIHLHISNDLPVAQPPAPRQQELETLAEQLLQAFEHRPEERQRVLDALHLFAPFDHDPDLARQIATKLRN